MKIQRMRNNVKITDVIEKGGKFGPYGFGLIMDGEPVPNFVFIPPHIVQAYDITQDDVGEIFDCVFRDDRRREDIKKDPVVIAILEDNDEFQETVVVSEVDLEGGAVGPPPDASSLPGFVTNQK